MANLTNIQITNLIKRLNFALGEVDLNDTVAFTEGNQLTLDHFIYNPITDKLEADRAIETTLNSLYLGEQHKMSSGSENIYFTNQTSNVNFYPAWGGIKDQSQIENQTDDGVYVPTARIFGSYGAAKLGGDPVLNTNIPYDGDNFFPFNISGMGITTTVAEEVPSHIRLKYELSVNGTPVYDQILEHSGLTVNQKLSWFFDHPLDIVGSPTTFNHASIRKIDTQEQDLGLLLVCQGSDETTWGGVRYQTEVQNRLFEDKVIAYVDDLETLDVVGYYDLYVDPSYVGTDSDGTNLRPYTVLSTAIGASTAGNKIFIKGDNIITEIVLPHSLSFYGIDGTKIRYAAYDSTNDNLLKFTGTDNTSVFVFKNIEFNNAGKYAINITGGAGSVDIIDCTFRNNGWSGANLNTVLASTVSSTLGYDSTQAELQAFYASTATSEGGAMRIETVTNIQIVGNKVLNNLRGIRIADCGINGNGFITRNVSAQNIESGIYLGVGSLNGCQNVTVTMNFSAYNANNGLLVIGGINNKFSQNEVNGNWNAGFCAWSAANTTLRDCGLYDNNRSNFNGIGNVGDAKASIQINENFDNSGSIITLNTAAQFICEILDTQVHYTGLGSNTDKVGVLISSDVGNLTDNDTNIIKIDDVGFIGQDFAIDLSEVDITNLRLSLGDNSYQSIGINAVKASIAGNYNELPFSNHVMAVPVLDVVVDTLKQSIALHEGVGGNVINTYKMNQLHSLDMGTHVDIILKTSDKIQLRGLLLNNVYINGSIVGNTVSSMNDSLNAAFNMDLVGYYEFLTSIVGINGGQSLQAQANNWYIAYGDRAGEQVLVPSIENDLKNQQPFYNGNFLEKGHEYVWTHDDIGSYMIGIYSGTQQATLETDIMSSLNWSTGYRFVRSSGRISGTDSVGVTINTNNSNTVDQWNVNNNTVLALRYGNDNFLYLLEITDGTELIIGRSNLPQIGDSITIFFGGENQPNAKFPVMIERTQRWTIVHDLDNSENGEWINGIEEHTVIKSNMELNPGEKITMNFDYFGRMETIGMGYSDNDTGVNNAENLLENRLFYNTAELLKDVGNWTWNISSSFYYNPVGDHSNVGYWNNNGNGNLGLISWRYKSDNTLEMWHETNNELIATLTTPLDGNPINIYIGSNENAHPASRIPELNKYDLTASEEGSNVTTWYYIESPDGIFTYPLFSTTEEANYIDTVEGGAGNSQGYSWGDEPTGATWYGPDTTFLLNTGGVAPSNGVYGNSTNVIWNEILTNDDSTYFPSAFIDNSITMNELTNLNYQIHPAGATFTTTIANAPVWITQATNNANITGTSPEVNGDLTNFPSTTFTIDIVRTFTGYGSSTGVLTIIVNNLTPLVSLPGTLHTGSVVAGGGSNSDGLMWLGDNTDMQLVYDIAVLEDGDTLEWYHHDQYYCYGIVSDGVDKTTDVAAYNNSPSARWDLMAPFTGIPTNTQGQNFGTVYSNATGLVPHGWNDNSTTAIPTRPVNSSSDIWKLFNNNGTIELSLNDVLFRSSSSTHTDPTITMAIPAQITGGTLSFPAFTHTSNTATAPTGFIIDYGTMDTSTLLNGNSVALLANLTLSPGERFIATKAWFNTNVLPYIDGASGEDNKVFVGVPKSGADWVGIVEQDFYAMHRLENQTLNLTKITQYHAGPSPLATNVNRSSDTDIHYNMAIEFTREGDLVVMRSSDSDPSLFTEPVIGGSFDHTQTWSGAYTTTGTSPLGLVIASKESETRVTLSSAGLSVIPAPLSTNQINVTENSSSVPLFNGNPTGGVTFIAGQTYKFWIDDPSIESTDSLGFSLISDNSDYTTGVTVVGTPGTFGAYVEFVIPNDVPPINVNWTSDGTESYSTLIITGSTYVNAVTGISFLGPSSNQTGTNLYDFDGTNVNYGWISLNETLQAGQRLVIPNTFLIDLVEAMSNNTSVVIGLKGSAWSNTVTDSNSSNNNWGNNIFLGGAYIQIMKYPGNYQGRIRIFCGVDGDDKSYHTIGINGAVYSSSEYNAFIEITADGNNIRVAHGANDTNAGDAAYDSYPNWYTAEDQTNPYEPPQKTETGNQGYGITSADVVIIGGKGFFQTAYYGDMDAADVDWTSLSEIATPTTAYNETDWSKAVDFSGSGEYLNQQSSTYNPIKMNGISTSLANNSNTNLTVNNTYSRPWAITIVFKSDHNATTQHIWNMGEGSSSPNDNIYLSVDPSRRLRFCWGREGESKNECYLTTLANNTTDWYGVYILHKGGRFSEADATSTNLANAFDIRIASSAGSWNIGSNLSTSSQWSNAYSNTGKRTNRDISGNFTVGGVSSTSTRDFYGKVANIVITTIMINSTIPLDSEIKLMMIDPMRWKASIEGTTRRLYAGNQTYAFQNGQWPNSSWSTNIFLMGSTSTSGGSDSFSNGIRNNIHPNDNTRLLFNNMQSNDIETVVIPSLAT